MRFLTLSLGLFPLVYALPTPQAKEPPKTTTASAFSTGTKGLPLKTDVDNSGGSGPYHAALFTDPTLPKHTIYAPATPPTDIKLPVIVWGNGLCAATGTFFYNFLMEIASHGFIVIADGAPAAASTSTSAASSSGGGTLSSLLGSLQMLSSGISTAKDQLDAVKWVVQGDKTVKYGNVDLENIAAAGQSCGGIMSYTAALAEPRIKATVLFNSGYIDRTAKTLALLKNLKGSVAYFLGDITDVGWANGKADFDLLPEGLPAIYANADIGHLGGFFEKQGGVNGRIAVPYFKYILKGDQAAKAMFVDNTFAKDGWNITTKNWK